MTGGRGDEHVPGPADAGPRGGGPGRPGAPGDPARHARSHGAHSDADADEVVEAEIVEDAPADEAQADDELAVLRAQRDEYLDMVRRVQADFENYKKRMVRQQTELLDRAAEGLVMRLLPVLDAFDLARAHLEAEGSPEGKALLQAAGLLDETLAKEGLERFDEVGVGFDPTTHEAVEHQPRAEGTGTAEDEHQGPVVSDVLRAGYRYKGRVVRPAMVRVTG